MLHKLPNIILSTIVLLLATRQGKASEVITINTTNKAPLFDGSCYQGERKSARMKLAAIIK